MMKDLAQRFREKERRAGQIEVMLVFSATAAKSFDGRGRIPALWTDRVWYRHQP
jgi:hypothetical protein